MPRTLVLRPCAKINLTLRVGVAQRDGFHEVRTVLQSIALSDRLTMTVRSGPFALSTRAAGVPVDQTNLVWRAAEALWRSIGRTGEPGGVHIALEKRIPVAAGLGGGSADAAAALLGLNALWTAKRSRVDLARIAATLGSDVPFFLQGGTAMGTGRGDELYPVDDIRRFAVVLITPSFGVSAADAYRWCDDDRRRPELAAPAGTVEVRPVDVGWTTGPIALENDLQAPVSRRHPAIGEMVQACLREGAIGAAMSGSGSAVYGLFREDLAKKAVDRLRRPDWLVLPTRTCRRAEAARRMGL